MAAGVVRADDRIDLTTTWFQEKRAGGGLTIIHPQFDVGVDVGETVQLGLGYSSDVVTGATASVYSVDAISTATQFDDIRHEGRVSIGFEGRRSTLTFSGGAGVERDYISLTAAVSASIDLPGKNTNLALSYTRNFDEVCDRDNTSPELRSVLEFRALTGDDECAKKGGLFGEDQPGMTLWQDVDIDTAQATLTQNVSPTLVLQGSLYGQVLNGYQANPYRRVLVSGVVAQEHLPDVRGRIALMVRANKYLESLRSAVHGGVRGYSDTWGVNSLAVEGDYSMYLGRKLLLRFGGRVYQQTEATFFKDAFFYQVEGPAEEFFTGDRELAPVRNVTLGAKFSYIAAHEDGRDVWGLFDEVRFNLKGDILLLDELPADPTELNLGGTDRQFLNAGQFLDAFVLQLGLLTRY
jgi:hypothetical protein